MSDRDDDLAATAADLEETMRALRRDLRRQAPRGPLGLPRPPSPREVLRFADEAAIPALIAILEANIRILEAIQAAIELADTTRRARTEGRRGRDRAVELGAETLVQFDEALSEFQRILEEGSLPEDTRAREILEDARTLRAELRERVEDAEKSTAGSTEPATDTSTPADASVDVDVDAELESIKQQVDNDDEEGADGDQTGSNR